jgi:hypothetical protein
MYEDCIETHWKAFGFVVALIFANVKNSKKLVGTIELFREDAFLVGQTLKISLRIHVA